MSKKVKPLRKAYDNAMDALKVIRCNYAPCIAKRKRIAELERFCLDIYNDFSKKESKREAMSVQLAWKEGRKIDNPLRDLKIQSCD